MSNFEITKDTLLEEIIKNKPQCIPIIEKHFGKGCIDCPGIQTESLEISAELHDINVEEILKELNNC